MIQIYRSDIPFAVSGLLCYYLIMIICNRCNISKPETGFYDSNLNTCKECLKEKSRLYRKNNLDKVRKYDRERGKTQKRKQANISYQEKQKIKDPEDWRERRKKACNKYRSNNRHKANAHQKLERAVKSGQVKKEPCRVCGDTKSEAHHEDYNYPLNVIWLCDKHHKEAHIKLRENKRNNG